MRSQHPFARFIRILGRGRHASRSLTQEEAREAMGMILDGEVEEIQLGAFLMLIRVREETPEEVAGFVQAVAERIRLPNQVPRIDLDWSSYAGKKRQLPWFILAALLLAGQGHTIFIHGARGHTGGRIYTFDALQALGIETADSLETATRQLAQQNFAYLDLRQLSPELHRLMELRPLLGLRSPIHTVARMINPFRADHVIQGIFHPGYLAIHQMAGKLLGQPHLAVIKGEGGEIERNPDMSCSLYTLHGEKTDETELPPMFGKRHTKPDHLDLSLLQKVWRGEESDEYGEAAIIGTAAIALQLLEPSLSDAGAIEKARAYWTERDQNRLIRS